MTEYVVNQNGCWIWLGELTGRGYAAIRIVHITYAAHRIFYENAKGKIPDGMVLDHLCRNIRCVNPDHLEPVTMKENTLRGTGPTAINAIKTRCPKGHLYDDDNLRIRRGRRHCNVCDTAHKSAYYNRKKVELDKDEEMQRRKPHPLRGRERSAQAIAKHRETCRQKRLGFAALDKDAGQ